MSTSRKQPSVKCPTCGAENLISTAFCKECSGRIYKDGAAPIAWQDAKKGSGLRAIRSFFSALILLSLATAIGLGLWASPVSDIPTSNGSPLQVKAALTRLESPVASGLPTTEMKISQQALNAFLGQNADGEKRKMLGAQLTDDRVLFMANEPLGPLNLTSRLEMKPGSAGDDVLVPAKLHIGRLPLPLALIPFWAERISAVFGLDVDPDLIERIQIQRAYKRGMVVGPKSTL